MEPSCRKHWKSYGGIAVIAPSELKWSGISSHSIQGLAPKPDQDGLLRYIRLLDVPASQLAPLRSSFRRKGCPAGVADAWTLACNGLEGSE